MKITTLALIATCAPSLCLADNTLQEAFDICVTNRQLIESTARKNYCDGFNAGRRYAEYRGDLLIRPTAEYLIGTLGGVGAANGGGSILSVSPELYLNNNNLQTLDSAAIERLQTGGDIGAAGGDGSVLFIPPAQLLNNDVLQTLDPTVIELLQNNGAFVMSPE